MTLVEKYEDLPKYDFPDKSWWPHYLLMSMGCKPDTYVIKGRDRENADDVAILELRSVILPKLTMDNMNFVRIISAFIMVEGKHRYKIFIRRDRIHIMYLGREEGTGLADDECVIPELWHKDIYDSKGKLVHVKFPNSTIQGTYLEKNVNVGKSKKSSDNNNGNICTNTNAPLPK